MENKLCYICSPYRGDTERNAKYAAALTRTAVEEYLDALRADGVSLLSVRPVTESDT